MLDNLLNSQVFRLKGRLFTMTVVQMSISDLTLFEQQVYDLVNQAPKLLFKMPVVLDCSSMTESLRSLAPYFNCLKRQHIYPIGVQGSQTWLKSLAESEEIPVFQASSSQDKPLKVESSSKEPIVRSTKLITQPVRSGQQIVSQGADLIIISSVGHGAELLADGNIHVYGPLRGRALAGIKGDKQARIFCTQLDAELVSIAGFYRLRESIPAIQGACQIFIQDDRLQIVPV
jgi:septum site-determining protein MinC